MRKWMRDRFKRRKKPGEQKPSAESQPAPLQPAYFEAAEPERAEKEVQAVDAEEPRPVERLAAPPQTVVSPEPPAGNGGERRGRRRRGRGGRGRRGIPGKTTQPALAREIAEPAAITPFREESGVAPEPIPAAAAEPIPGREFPATARRVAKGVVVLAIGLPGSGKSSWFKRHKIRPLSSDLLRELLFDDPTEQRFQDLVFSNLRSLLKARLIARKPTNYVDATNLTPHDRHNWIKLAKDFGYDVQAVFFDVPLEVCLDRNLRRHRVVDEDVMRRMAGNLRPPSFAEGFAKITVVKVKKKD